MKSLHPSQDHDNADLVAEVRALAERVLTTIRLLEPSGYRNIWESPLRVDNYAKGFHVMAAEFRLTCDTSGWVAVADTGGKRTFTVFTAWLGNGPLEFSWDQHVCRNFLAAALDRVLVLEDLASL